MENEIDVVEKEIEEGGESGLVSPVSSDDQLIVLEKMAQNADRMIAAKQKVWTACLKITKAGDWTVFSSNGKKKAELGGAGSLRYAAFLGIGFSNWTAEKVTGTDEKGSWYRWDFECDAVFAGRTIRVYGRAGSRDKFFGKDHGSFKELHDINEGDIKIAGRRNCMKEGVKCLMGLHHMDPNELEAAGVKMESAMGYEFKGKGAEAQSTTSVACTVKDITVKKGEKNGKSWAVYKVITDNGDFGTFSETFAKTAKTCKETGVQAEINYQVGQYGNEIVSIEPKV